MLRGKWLILSHELEEAYVERGEGGYDNEIACPLDALAEGIGGGAGTLTEDLGDDERRHWAETHGESGDINKDEDSRNENEWRLVFDASVVSDIDEDHQEQQCYCQHERRPQQESAPARLLQQRQSHDCADDVEQAQTYHKVLQHVWRHLGTFQHL